MTRYQRARRLVFWRGLATALLTFTAFIALLGLSEHIANL